MKLISFAISYTKKKNPEKKAMFDSYESTLKEIGQRIDNIDYDYLNFKLRNPK